MALAGNAAYEVTEIEFGQAGDVPLLARLYSPKGVSGFPAIVDVHGGAWTGGSRMDNASMHDAIAASGIAVLALEFRLAPGTPYPGPVADVNLGIRWLKRMRQDSEPIPNVSVASAHRAAVINCF